MARRLRNKGEALSACQLFGLLAHPVLHSLSPRLYKKWFQECGMKHAKFELFDVAPEALSDFMLHIARGSEIIAGFAVSIPHKEAVMEYLDEIDHVAKEIGAVNTIQIRRDLSSDSSSGSVRLSGFNTDWIGVREVFRDAGVHLKDKRVLVLGAGGAARAVVYALMQKCAHVVVANRTFEKAKKLASQFRCSVVHWNDRESIDAEIVVNTTSMGLENQSESPVSMEFWKRLKKRHVRCVVFDLVYRPKMTKFLRDAKRIGACVLTGDLMLVSQGHAQFEILTGRRVQLIREGHGLFRHKAKRTVR